MSTCFSSPATLEALLGVLTCAARAYGGTEWSSLALLGLGGACLLLLILLLVIAAARGSMRL